LPASLRHALALLLVVAAALTWWLRRDDPPAPAAPSPAAPVVRAPGLRAATAPARAPAGVSGTVRDERGDPVAGARVCAWRVGGWLADDLAPDCSDSGPDGYYALELPPLRHLVHAGAPGRRPGLAVAAWLRPGERRTGVDLELGDGGVRVVGVVRDVGGGVVEGAWVTDLPPGGAAPATVAAARSGADGRFELWLAPGDVDLFALADGYADGHLRAAAPGPAAGFVLTPESVLVGEVVDADTGDPVAGAEVVAVDDVAGARATLSDGDGRFRLARLPPGRWRARARAPGAAGEAGRSVLLGLGETSPPLRISLYAQASVAGRVRLRGREGTCPRGQVYLAAPDLPAPLGAAIDGAGEVLFPAVPPGRYEVQVVCPGFLAVPAALAVDDAPLDDQVWEVDPGLEIHGEVVDAGGRPAPGLVVAATPTAEGLAGGFDLATDGAGRFVVSGLRPGEFALTLTTADGHPRGDARRVVLVDRDLEDVRLVLPPAGGLRGEVVDDRGDPVVGARVTAVDAQGGGGSARTGDDGRFALAGLRAGAYTVQAARDAGLVVDDGPQASARVDADGVAELRLVLPGARAELRGRVVDPDGEPVGDAFVVAARGPAAALGDGDPVLTDVDGRFVLGGLVDAAHTVRAYRRGGGEALVEGARPGADLTLTISPTLEISGTVAGADLFAVTVLDEGGRPLRSERFDRTAGRWALDGLVAGRYVLRADAPGGAAGLLPVDLVDARGDLRLELRPPGRVRGRVVDADHAPVADVQVHVLAPPGPFAPPAPQRSDRDGRFELTGVPAGPAQVGADGGAEARVDVPAGGAAEVTLAPP
jgi:protocatechuate 3,4-dioxygenase beta subunit